jgi:hypothetical protein
MSSGLTLRGGSEVSFNAVAISSLRASMVEEGGRRRTRVVLWERILRMRSMSEAYFGG